MRVPPIDTFEGVYWYIIALIVGLALVSLLYLAGMRVGAVPDFSHLY